jgi:hypothetical protein
LETKVARKDFYISLWAMCGLGHACDILSFRRAGLKRSLLADCPVYLAQRGLEAGATFFGIDYYDARNLFTQLGYPLDREVTPKMVAKAIRKLVKRLNDNLAREKAKVADDKPCRKEKWRVKFRRLPAMA